MTCFLRKTAIIFKVVPNFSVSGSCKLFQDKNYSSTFSMFSLCFFSRCIWLWKYEIDESFFIIVVHHLSIQCWQSWRLNLCLHLCNQRPAEMYLNPLKCPDLFQEWSEPSFYSYSSPLYWKLTFPYMISESIFSKNDDVMIRLTS